MSDCVPLVPPDVFARVRRLRLHVLRRVRTALAGAYRSAVGGSGLEFLELTPYEPGDDVRRIDWPASAGRARPYVRRYAEERQVNVVIAMDVSASMDVRAAGRTPREAACTLAAAVGLAAAGSGDRVGAFLFGGDAVRAIPCRSGERHVLSIVSRALCAPAGAGTTDIRPVLSRIRALRGHAVILLLSDFLHRPSLREAPVCRRLAACARKHDLRAVRLEVAPAAVAGGRAFVAGRDAETGAPILRAVGRFSGGVCDAVRTAEHLTGCGVRHVHMYATDDWFRPLCALLASGRPAARGPRRDEAAI
ncbi:MAG: DUF58 domain-containing protein [Candidatus Brocadiaceae bacterium]|nr:DUF58 domain-containing protein [Candidatus Brocadiaceae bacterium]